jgi:mannose-6-phosphate isomerase-like protein (cupin superfamily)
MANPSHIHDDCDELIVLLAGVLEQRVGEETVRLEPGDVLLIPAGVPHSARSVGEVNADMVITYNSGDRHYREVEGGSC